MKNLILIIVVLVIFTFAACEDNSATINDEVASVQTISGRWQVAKYIDDSDDETSSFNNIIFVIESNGNFIIERNATEIADGTWQLRNQNRELVINVPVLANENESLGEDLYEIHDDWNILVASENQLHLQDEDERFELKKAN
jgi:hypothetical protein